MRRLRVLIVDDSAFTRRVLREMLAGDPLIAEVDGAGNGRSALEKAVHRPPDLILLDLQMPVMDGFTFLRLFRKHSTVPVLVISALTDLEYVERCVQLGANGFIAKPKDSYRQLKSISQELRLKIRQQFDPTPPSRPLAASGALPTGPREVSPQPREDYPVVVIGSSSGGPQTLQYLLTGLPRRLTAAVLIAQHLPPGFTQSFAERLNSLIVHTVREARHGEVLRPGEILLCPGGRNLSVCGGAQRPSLCVEEPSGEIHVPNVDRLFASAARIFGSRLTGFVLTGMGKDGAAGVQEIKAHGGRVYAESQQTAAIYGMPKEAAATGCVDEVLDLPDIAVRLIRIVADSGIDSGAHSGADDDAAPALKPEPEGPDAGEAFPERSLSSAPEP